MRRKLLRRVAELVIIVLMVGAASPMTIVVLALAGGQETVAGAM
jgi:hypothetical protein